jgi:uncharacterized membrane protein YfcA
VTVVILAAVVAAVVGGAAQAVTGFGFALVAVPLLTLTVTPHDAVIVVTATSAVLSAGAAAANRGHIHHSLTTRIALAALLGMPFGLVALLVLPARVLTVAVAMVAPAFLALSITPVRGRTGQGLVVSAGLISGAALTATGMNGPPVVAALHAFHLSPVRQRATLQAIFTMQDVLAVVAFAVAGQMTGRIWLLALCAVPGAGIGWVAGNRFFQRLDDRISRRLVAALLLVTTIALVMRTILT